MEWIPLILAGCCEIAGVAGIKRMTRKPGLLSALMLLAAFGCSFSLLSLAMRSIPMATAYAIWTGIGTAGAAFLGMVRFGESRDWRRLVCIAAIVGSAIGLKLLG
ncbi:DMT family transporter [Paenibacillus glufosinatiresistens]|uniref:DMT family transporter n=1 Tax=Paenibacillus glufosinatiresistens TaxID=3070657 RepID=UPI00286DB71F|nr:multidrug efflux SMR transporter [Paenibacillus sp. YX.27]